MCAGFGRPPASRAQTAPSPAEVAQFGVLHSAAHSGDLARLVAALAGGAPVNGRDSRGRTPLHVAAFARQREATAAWRLPVPSSGRWRTTATTR